MKKTESSVKLKASKIDLETLRKEINLIETSQKNIMKNDFISQFQSLENQLKIEISPKINFLRKNVDYILKSKRFGQS